MTEVLARPDQPRQHYDALPLMELAESIDKHGQAMPAIVRVHPDPEVGARGMYELVAGERRWRAISLHCKRVKTLRAVVTDLPSDHAAWLVSVIENANRVDLTPLEAADAAKRLHDQDYNNSDIARVMGCTAVHVADLLLLASLHPEVRATLEESRSKSRGLTVTAAVAIARLPQEMQPEVAKVVAARDLRSTETMEHVDLLLGQASGSVGRTSKTRTGSHRQLCTNMERMRGVLDRRFGGYEDVRASYYQHKNSAEVDEMLTEVKETLRQVGLFYARLRKVRKLYDQRKR